MTPDQSTPAGEKITPRIIRIVDRLNSTRPVILLTVLLSLQIITHVAFLNLPPAGFHAFRQTQTTSIARNFYEGETDFLHPRIDSRGARTGITGMELPLVNYTMAIGYRLFGYSYTVQRATILLFSLVGIAGCFLFLSRLFTSRALAFVGAGALIFSPLHFYYSSTALPDIPAIAFLFLSLGLWLVYRDSQRRRYLILSALFLAVAGLLKIYCLMALAFYGLEVLSHWRDWRRALGELLVLTIAVAIVGGWYVYARYLNDLYQSGAFKMESSFPYSWSVVPTALKRVFVQWLPELYVNYAAFLFLIAGAWTLHRSSTGTQRRFVLGFTIVTAIFIFLMLPSLIIHDYYMISALPLLIVLVTLGVQFGLQQARHRRSAAVLVTILLLLLPILGMARAVPRFTRTEVPSGLQGVEAFLNRVIPDHSSLVVAAADDSPIIYLYYMHRKGWSVTAGIPTDSLCGIFAEGPGYFISDSRPLEQRPDIRACLDSLASNGTFTVFRIIADCPSCRTDDTTSAVMPSE